MRIIQAIVTLFYVALYGGRYCVKHIDPATGKSNCYWCNTLKDALEWAACAVNSDIVRIVTAEGYFVAYRKPIAA